MTPNTDTHDGKGWAVRFATGLSCFARSLLRNLRPAGFDPLPQDDFAAELERRLAARKTRRADRSAAAVKGWQTRRAG
jgi:hypothetical protein